MVAALIQITLLLFFKEKEIDGALVGGASLNGEKFALIANIFNDLKG